MSGLSIAEAQNGIFDFIEANAPAGYQVVEGDIDDAFKIQQEDGVRQTTWVVQFSDMLPKSGDTSFCGPTNDGYYSIFRIYSLGSTARAARTAGSMANQLILGKTLPNVSSISKEFGGGSFTISEANSRPIVYVSIASFRFMTNIVDVGSTVFP